MGLIARRPLQAGERLEAADLDYAFPTLGIPVEACDQVIGRRLKEAVATGSPLQADELDG